MRGSRVPFPTTRTSGRHPEEQVTRGRAYREILKVVEDEGVGLIVMGVQGKGALNRLVFGSTTHRVIHGAAYPFLTSRG